MKKILLSFFAVLFAAQMFAVDRITVAEFLQKADTETTYELTGLVKTVKNTTYGNFYLEQDGSQIYIYGLVDSEGTTKIWGSLGINEGDSIVVQGVYTTYDETPEIKNAVYVSHKANTAVEVDITNTPETAYTVAEALNLIAAGEGLSTKVYVKGTVLPDGLSVSTQYGNATYFITDDGTNQLEIYRGYYLENVKFTSEDQLQDGDEVIVYGQLTDYNGTYEMTSGNYIYSLNGKTQPDVEPYTLTGDGTLSNAYTAADVNALFADADNTPTAEVWVKGTILGNVNTSTGATIVPDVFTDVNGDGKVDDQDAGEGETVAVATNISLGDDDAHISVQLPKGDVRTNVNILDNPSNIGKEVWLCGVIQKYCGVAGLKSVSQYSFNGTDAINAIHSAANSSAIYNLAGQRVSSSFKGIVIENGKKVVK